MCDVPSIAVFCSESIECFPGTASKFFLKLLVTIPLAPVVTGIIVHFRFHINLYYYYYYYYYCCIGERWKQARRMENIRNTHIILMGKCVRNVFFLGTRKYIAWTIEDICSLDCTWIDDKWERNEIFDYVNENEYNRTARETGQCSFETVEVFACLGTVLNANDNIWTEVEGRINDEHRAYFALLPLLNTLRTRSFKLFKRPFPGFLTILTL